MQREARSTVGYIECALGDPEHGLSTFRHPAVELEAGARQQSSTRIFAIDTYRHAIARRAECQRLNLADTDFDTGKMTKRGQYSMADETYDPLLEKLADRSSRTSRSPCGRTSLPITAT
jgi:hypothetical protein